MPGGLIALSSSIAALWFCFWWAKRPNDGGLIIAAALTIVGLVLGIVFTTAFSVWPMDVVLAITMVA